MISCGKWTQFFATPQVNKEKSAAHCSPIILASDSAVTVLSKVPVARGTDWHLSLGRWAQKAPKLTAETLKAQWAASPAADAEGKPPGEAPFGPGLSRYSEAPGGGLGGGAGRVGAGVAPGA